MSRAQDQFIDEDEEETCPLCVEELDITDRGFRPCPCGYQICQFCYHNVKNNMNGLCPACRRPYNDNDIVFHSLTADEQAAHKARQAQKQKKTQAALQKEKQKAEADTLSRKHLAGLRVVQKNLVYVTGLAPASQEDQLLQTLRGNDYFGQYGKIIKIVVSKARDPSHPNSIGVYVTYERKEDAVTCIAAVDGSKNGERTLRAQFGTTKYCSAYLRGDTCTNRNCMFLHEPGEANDSYSRADLSALNARHSGTNQPPPQSQQPIASAAPMAREKSNETSASPAPDRPALPSTASWASKPVQPSRAESRSTSGNFDSPAVSNATPATVEPQQEVQQQIQESSTQAVAHQTVVRPRKKKSADEVTSILQDFLKSFHAEDFKSTFAFTNQTQADIDIINAYPPLFDPFNGGKIRRQQKQREEQQIRAQEEIRQQQTKQQQSSNADQDEQPEMSGSMQLGGEPEERQGHALLHTHGDDGDLDQRFQFGGVTSPGISDRGATSQQQQQRLLQAMTPPAPGLFNQPSTFQGSMQPQNGLPGHQRNASRYTFANDSSSATAAVKPVANQKMLNQQQSMLPSGAGNHFGVPQQTSGQFFTSNVQGPPPGLKTSGTPPVSGGMTFGQGHGFATGGLQYGAGAGSRNPNEEMYQTLLRGRNASTADAAVVSAKHDADFPALPPSRQTSISIPARLNNDDTQSRQSTPPVPPGFEAQAASRSSTPVAPPGLISRPTAVPDLEGTNAGISTRAVLKRTASGQVQPVMPLRPATPRVPSRVGTPLAKGAVDHGNLLEQETPTKQATELSGGVLGVERSETNEVIPDDQDEKPSLSASVANTAAWSALPPNVSAQPDTVALPHEPTTGKGRQAVHDTNAKSTPTKPDVQRQEKAVQQSKVDRKADKSQRKQPGKLDTSAAIQEQEKGIGDKASSVPPTEPPETSRRVNRKSSRQPLSAVEQDESLSVASPATAKAAPRTLRLVQTPKSENAAVPSTSAQQSLPTPALEKFKQPSRQPSVASIQLPGTPSSEHVSMSDTVSLTSTSQSRANSPPPSGSSKVGTAPVRTKTKSQVKKERQERAVDKIKDTEDLKPITLETQQEAILSRKKKTKKEKEPKPPKPKPVAEPTAAKVEPETTLEPSTPDSREERHRASEQTTTEQESHSAPSTPIAKSTPPPARVAGPSPPPTPTMTAASLIAELRASAPEIQRCIDSLFRTPGAPPYKPPHPISPKDLAANPATWKSDFKLDLMKEEVEALLTQKVPAVRYGGEDGRTWNRGMITPTGAHLRALTEELEARFLELEKAIRELPEELRFHATKPQNDTKFPSVDLESLRRQFESISSRMPSVMEQIMQENSSTAMSSQSKRNAVLIDQASKYINEFVIPPATPPPSAGGTRGTVHPPAAGGDAHSVSMPEQNMPHLSLEVIERQLADARRVAEGHEQQLRKQVKKVKKMAGYN